MRVRINIEKVGETVAQVIPSAGQRKRIVRSIGSAAMQHWKKLAQSELRSTSRDYIAGLQRIKNGIELVGTLPNQIEQGWSGGDMRGWMSKSGKAKRTKDGGWYLHVPFRHGSSKSGGRNVGAPMPQKVGAAARKLSPPTLSAPGQGTKWGERLSPHKGPGEKIRGILNTKAKDWHTTSIYTGMVRKEKVYQNATQSSYGTFRTISSKGDPRSWIHPGIRARRFAPRVREHIVRKVLPMVVQQLMQGQEKK